MLKLSLTYALFLSAPTTCTRERARAHHPHIMHLICTYRAVFNTNSIQTFSINSSPGMCLKALACLLACQPFSHFDCSVAHSLVWSLCVHAFAFNKSFVCFIQHSSVWNLSKKNTQRKKTKTRKREGAAKREKGNNWNCCWIFMQWMNVLVHHATRHLQVNEEERERDGEIERNWELVNECMRA